MENPQLVDYDKCFKKKKIIKIKQINIDFFRIFINISCILLLCIGFYCLYFRHKNKEVNKLIYEKNIYEMTQKINEELSEKGRED